MKIIAKNTSTGGGCILTSIEPGPHTYVSTRASYHPPNSRTGRGGGGRNNGRKPASKGGGSGSDGGPCFAYGNKKFGNKGPSCKRGNCPYRHTLSDGEKKRAKKGNL